MSMRRVLVIVLVALATAGVALADPATVTETTQTSITLSWKATGLTCGRTYSFTLTGKYGKNTAARRDLDAKTAACGSPPPAPQPPPSPQPTSPPAPPPAPAYLFADEFGGAAGARPDPSKWVVNDNNDTSPTVAYTSYVAGNAFQDGQGNLVLRVSQGTRGRPYNGALLATFDYGSGWPPSSVKAALAPPVHIEARMKMPSGAGFWPALWPLGTNASAPVLEIDIAELRMFQNSVVTFHTHNVANDDGLKDVGLDLSQAFHVYACDYYSNHIDFFFDGGKIGTLPLPAGTAQAMGPTLWNIVGIPGTWGGEGGPPASLANADLVVDYVRASRIAVSASAAPSLAGRSAAGP